MSTDAENSRVLLERISTQMEMHIKSDERIVAEIQHSLKNMSQVTTALGEKFDKAFERVHTRIDENAKATVTAIEEVQQFAQEAHDQIKNEKIKTLTAIIMGGLAAIGAVVQWAAGHLKP